MSCQCFNSAIDWLGPISSALRIGRPGPMSYDFFSYVRENRNIYMFRFFLNFFCCCQRLVLLSKAGQELVWVCRAFGGSFYDDVHNSSTTTEIAVDRPCTNLLMPVAALCGHCSYLMARRTVDIARETISFVFYRQNFR